MNEKIAVVDKNNHVVTYKERAKLTDKDCWRASCIWVEDGKGNVLMQKRTADRKVDPSTWTCAAVGTVTADDSYEQTAKRELYEEIGVRNVPLKPTRTLFCRASFGSRWLKGYTALCNKPLDTFKIQEEEVSEIAWMDKQKVLEEIEVGDPKYAFTAKYYKELFNL